MKCSTRKLRPPFKWHGGKTYLARRIIALFPEHETYVEPFLGGGSILLNKPPSLVEYASDVYGALMSAWQTIRDFPIGIRLAATPYCSNSFEAAKATLATNGPVSVEDAAVAFVVRNRMSRGGLGKDFAWSDRLRGGQPGDVNAWQTFLRIDLPAVYARIQNVQMVNWTAEDAIQSHDGPGTLHYCDPPYLHETRTVKKAYAFEMDRAAHVSLLETLKSCRGKVVLSGYRSPLYDAALAGWTRHDFSMPNHSGQGKTKKRRVECVWCNFSAEDES